MSTFDLKAATWDAEPGRRVMAQAIVTAILRHVPVSTGMRVLDVGCGTGLVGLPLASLTGNALGVDLSTGMVERFLAKVATAELAGVRAEVRDVIADPLPPTSIDVVVSAMAFHHIPDIAALLAALHRTLVPGGWLAVADLESEDGSFHGNDPVPHNGFAPEKLAEQMQAAGYTVIATERVHVMTKQGRDYPIFLAVARR
jgi:predicted TPR repeat methyltransferase